MSNAWRLIRAVLGAVLLGLIVLAQGCGGGGSGSNNAAAAPGAATADEEGTLIIGITDAQGDFVSYVVDVESLVLEQANGTVVEALPFTTRIDFSELTEVTEFLTVATVPVGVYESVVLNLDYSDAEVVVQDDNGNALLADVVDTGGNAITLMPVRLKLTSSDVIRISPGVPASFSLDFDLDASNEIDLSMTPPIVTVEPFLLAVPELEADRAHRVRGVLAQVNEPASEITLKVRPFRHRSGDFGRFTFSVDDDTQYEINGEGYTGSLGLAEMALLSENTPVLAGVSVTDSGFVAFTVLAGSSVPWADTDVLKGVVSARNGDELIVRGARVEFGDGTDVFRGTYTLLVGEDTTVTALGVDNAELDEDSISVGQRIVAFGDIVTDAANVTSDVVSAATSQVIFDARQGRVRMLINQLTAQVVQAEPLAVDLFFLNGRRPDAFDFSGTGFTPAEDADPDFYEIDTGALSLGTISDGDLVRVRGLVNEFGVAPPDYLARTVIDVQTDMRSASLKVGWDGGTEMPFETVTGERIDLDLSAARSLLKIKGVPVGFGNPLEDMALIAPASGSGAYAVKVRGAGEIHLYRSFADMVDELKAQLDAGNLLHRIGAHGRYNGGTEELTTGRASFVFGSPTAAEG
jgi:hypothetical protein